MDYYKDAHKTFQITPTHLKILSAGGFHLQISWDDYNKIKYEIVGIFCLLLTELGARSHAINRERSPSLIKVRTDSHALYILIAV